MASSNAASEESDGGSAVDTARQAKRALRTLMRKTIAELRPTARVLAARRAADVVLRAPPLARAHLVLMYRALPDEIDTDPLIAQLASRGVGLVFPLVFPLVSSRTIQGESPRGVDAPKNPRAVRPSNALSTLRLFALQTSDPMCNTLWRTDRYGIRAPDPDSPHVRRVQPREIDAVIVPGRAFDAMGRRLGRGKGFYDALLPKLRPDARAATVGFAYACQEVPEVPVESHDARVAWLVTDRRLTRCGDRSKSVLRQGDECQETSDCADE